MLKISTSSSNSIASFLEIQLRNWLQTEQYMKMNTFNIAMKHSCSSICNIALNNQRY